MDRDPLATQFLVSPVRYHGSFITLNTTHQSINLHAKELLSKFVSHEGKKELKVIAGGGNRYSVDFGKMAQTMTQELIFSDQRY